MPAPTMAMVRTEARSMSGMIPLRLLVMREVDHGAAHAPSPSDVDSGAPRSHSPAQPTSLPLWEGRHARYDARTAAAAAERRRHSALRGGRDLHAHAARERPDESRYRVGRRAVR